MTKTDQQKAMFELNKDFEPWQDYAPPAARTLEVNFKVSTGFAELVLEQTAPTKQVGRLELQDGTATARVGPGDYILGYRGRTNTPHEPYTIGVTAPEEAMWAPDPKQRSDEGCIVLGIHTFTIN